MEIASKPYTMSHSGEWGSWRKEIIVIFFLSVWPRYIFSLHSTFHLDPPALWIDGETETGSQSSDTWATYFLELLHVLAVFCQIPLLSNTMNESLCSHLDTAPTFLTLALWPVSGAQKSSRQKSWIPVGAGTRVWGRGDAGRVRRHEEVGTPERARPAERLSAGAGSQAHRSQLHASLPESPFSVLTVVAWNQH